MTPLSYWIGFHLALLLLLALEYGLHRVFPDPRRKAMFAVVLWVVAALALAAWMVPHYHAIGAQQFLAGYVLEESLSIDNLFVFLLLFQYFRITEPNQPRVLFWGVLGAVLMRGAFVLGGLTLLQHFEWLTYVFALIILAAAIRLVKPEGANTDPQHTPRWLVWIARLRPISIDQTRFFTVEDGRRMATVLLLALLAVECSDVIFALDSIPAVLSITREPFLAYTSNILAVMSLRSLYVLLVNALAKLRYLHYGLAAVLAFAAAKMLAERWFHPSPLISLAVIAGLLGLTIAASLLTPPARYPDRRHE